MKRLGLLVVLCLFLAISIAAAEVRVDLTQSVISAKSGTTIRVEHITFPDYPNLKAWIDFTWDANTLTFVPIAADVEPPQTGYTWTINVLDGGSGGGYIEYKLTSHPESRSFDLQMKHLSGGSFFYCYSEDYVQGNNTFGLNKYLSTPSMTEAKITFQTAFSCGAIYAGQTVMATITLLPDWFDFAKPFMMTITAKPWTFYPDGTKKQL